MLLNQQQVTDKIYLYAKNLFESKYQLLFNGRRKVGIKKFKNLTAFIKYSDAIDDFHERLKDYHPKMKRKVLIVFDDMRADMKGNKLLNSPMVTELFLRGRKLNISLVFISQFYFKVPKTIRLNATHYFIVKIPKKRELQQIASNHSSGIEFKDFVKLSILSEQYHFTIR